MICFPNAKINLGLNILDKRTDGFHSIETVFYPVSICDALEIIDFNKTEIVQHGLELDNAAKDNIVLKAFNTISASFTIPPQKIHLLKNIPFGAGLGGGSADAAFALQLLNKKFDLQLSISTLKELASQIGSDCPFFIENKPALATGRGEILEAFPLDLSGYSIQLICPAIHISTKQAYSGVQPKTPDYHLSKTLRQPIEEWKHNLKNDFEDSVFAQAPLLAQIKNTFYTQGALYSSMSGSGSTVFGIFPKNKKANIRLDIGFREFIV